MARVEKRKPAIRKIRRLDGKKSRFPVILAILAGVFALSSIVVAVYFLALKKSEPQVQEVSVMTEAVETENIVEAGMQTEMLQSEKRIESELTPEMQTEVESQSEEVRDVLENEITEVIAGMTLEEKIAQLLVVTPEALVKRQEDEYGGGSVQEVGEITKQEYEKIPVSGILVSWGNTLNGQSEELQNFTRKFDELSREQTNLPITVFMYGENLRGTMLVKNDGSEEQRVDDSALNLAGIDVLISEDNSVWRLEDEDGDVTALHAIAGFMKGYEQNAGYERNTVRTDIEMIENETISTDVGAMESETIGTDVEVMESETIGTEAEITESRAINTEAEMIESETKTSDQTDGGGSYESKAALQLKKRMAENTYACVILEEGIETAGEGELEKIGMAIREHGTEKYEGVVICIINNKDENAVVNAVKVGADLILYMEEGGLHEMFASLVAAVDSGEIAESEIDERLKRIVRMKLTYFSGTHKSE